MAKIKIKYKKGGPSQIPALRAALSLFCSIFWIRTSISDGSICGILSDSAIFFRASRLLRGTNARPILYHSRAFMSLSIVKHFYRRDTDDPVITSLFAAPFAYVPCDCSDGRDPDLVGGIVGVAHQLFQHRHACSLLAVLADLMPRQDHPLP